MLSINLTKWYIPFKLLVIFASAALVLPGDKSQLQNMTATPSSSPSSIQKTQAKAASPSKTIPEIAHSIVVKVISKDPIGSGIIIHKQGSTYTVITNQHVLRAGESPYQIQTPDGKTYDALPVKKNNFKGYDLALLQFRSPVNIYDVARLASSSNLTVGEEVYAAGFPHLESEKLNNNSIEPKNKIPTEFVVKTGRVSVILGRALQEGYQIGYTNDVIKGMSGGPLLNSQGETIGVNGKHAYPLWDAPDLYTDGSQLCKPLQELITRSSLAIPIEKVVKLDPTLAQIELNNTSSQSLTNNGSNHTNSNKTKKIKQLISQMKAEAEAKQRCTELPKQKKSGSSKVRIEL